MAVITGNYYATCQGINKSSLNTRQSLVAINRSPYPLAMDQFIDLGQWHNTYFPVITAILSHYNNIRTYIYCTVHTFFYDYHSNNAVEAHR